jgi:phage terminase large subunit-like protein
MSSKIGRSEALPRRGGRWRSRFTIDGEPIESFRSRVRVTPVRASRGKVTRAEPVAALYERGLVHHVGTFRELEDQLTSWDPTHSKSPDRLDALVWAIHSLALTGKREAGPLRAYL